MLGVGTCFPLAVANAAAELRPELGVSRAQLGLAAGLFYGVTGAASVVGGVAADRWGAGRTTVASSLLGTLGLVVCLLDSTFSGLLLAAVCCGAGYALGNAGSSVLLAGTLRPDQRDRGFTIRTAGVPVMVVLSAACVPPLAGTAGWHAVVGVLLALSVLLIALVATTARGGRAVAVERPVGGRELPSGFWVFPLAALLFLSGSTPVNSWAQLYFVEGLHRSNDVAGLLVSLCFAVGAVFLLSAGRWGGPRLRGHRALVSGTVLCASGVAALIVAPRVDAGLGVVGLMVAVCGNLLVVTIVQSVVVSVAPQAAGRATGLLLTGYYIGALCGPSVFGALTDVSGYGLAWAGSLVALVLAFAAFAGCRRVGVRPA